MAEEMGYRPNVIAQGLKRKGTKTIALVVPDITNPFFITVAIGVQEKIRAFGYHMILANTNRNLETEAEEINLLCHRMIDGLVICPLWEAGLACLSYLRTHKVPFVIVSRDVKGIAAPVVLPDDFYGAYLATAHLADQGHTPIAHIAGPGKASVTEDRIAGYKAALAERGLSTDRPFVTMGPLDMSGGYEGPGRF
ncbi:MAG: LacI family DNA-binding transcriptional regulator [Candidatus Latescibacteria bacterium]|nr:LacI family DNA-binding transcriptional regulator [Candidatus Latescibacterota bacterium]